MPTVPPGYKVVPIYYYPSLRPWYWLLDWWQPKWYRFAPTRTGRFTRWLGRVIRWVTPRLLKVLWFSAKILAGAMFVVGMATFYMMMMFFMTGKVKR